jgi:hypothetical protein
MNNLLTMSYITNESLVVLENELILANRIDRQYSKEFAQTGAKVGNTISIRRPPRYVGTYGPPLNIEDTNESSTPLSLNYQFHVDVQFTTQDLALSMDQFKKRVIRPQIATVANNVDSNTALFCTLNTATVIGTFGTAPASYKIFTDARANLASEACPPDGEKNLVLDPYTMSASTNLISGFFNPQVRIGEFIEKGMIAKQIAGLDWWEDQNITTFQTGPQGGAPAIATIPGGSALMTTGWSPSGTLQTKGWTPGVAVVNVGDTIQIAGVYPVNPQNRMQYGKTTKQFVVLPPGGFVAPPNGTAASGIVFGAATLPNGGFNPLTGQYSADAGGLLTLTIGDALVSSGQFQNCTQAPAPSALITVNGGVAAANVTSPQGLCFHKYAYTLGFADLPLPGGVAMAARAYDDQDTNMSIRMITQYTINNDSEPTRADVLYGIGSLYRSLGIRIAG